MAKRRKHSKAKARLEARQQAAPKGDGYKTPGSMKK